MTARPAGIQIQLITELRKSEDIEAKTPTVFKKSLQEEVYSKNIEAKNVLEFMAKELTKCYTFFCHVLTPYILKRKFRILK